MQIINDPLLLNPFCDCFQSWLDLKVKKPEWSMLTNIYTVASP